MSPNHQAQFLRSQTAVYQNKTFMVAGGSAGQRSVGKGNTTTPLDDRYKKKKESVDAATAVKNSAALVPCVFAYNGGIHPEFDATLVKMFGQTEIEHIFTWGGNPRDAVHYARQTTTASIVNSHAQY